MASISERVIKIILQHLHVPPEAVTPEASLFDDLAADSLDIVKLILAFEDAFTIEIANDAMEATQTVGDAIAIVTALVDGKP